MRETSQEEVAEATARAAVAAEAETRALMAQVADLDEQRVALTTEKGILVSKRYYLCRYSYQDNGRPCQEGTQMLPRWRVSRFENSRAIERLRPKLQP